MELKKNPKADLTTNSSLYFVIGLSVVLFITWQAIEWKTYDKSLYGYEALNVEDEDDEEIPITEQLKTPPPPPPPPPAPEVIEVVEDEEEVEETVIESTETDEDEVIEVENSQITLVRVSCGVVQIVAAGVLETRSKNGIKTHDLQRSGILVDV